MVNFEKKPWYRALARFCDYCLFFLALGAVTLFLPYFYGPFFYYYLALAVPFLWAPVEAFFLAKWTTTPGKALFGMSVWNQAVGTKLSYSAALKRAFFIPRRPGMVYQKNISWKRKLFAFAASSAFVLAAIYGNVLTLWSVGLEKGISVDGWVQYSSNDVGFKVSFPTDPEHESKELVIPNSGKVLNYKEISSEESGKISYKLNHMELPRKWRLAGNTTLLKGVLDALVKHTKGAELLEKEFTMHQGYRALDFRLKQGENEMKGRILIVGGTLYKLTIDYPSSIAKEMAENPFINSFEVS
jgi:uncharacterized RDD family membrane protein YckC